MAGVFTHPVGRPSRRVHRAPALAAAAVAFCLLLLIGRSGSPGEAVAAQASQACPPQPFGLAPPGDPVTRFTMMIRINTQGNINTWTQFNQANGGLAGYVRPQDIFVLNTRFTGTSQFPPMTAAVAAGLSAQLRATFPCNRIVDLNGMSFDPNAAGYAFTGIDDPNVFALLTDYEQSDWNAGRLLDPARPPWIDKFDVAFPRLKAWNFTLASTVAANPVGTGKRTGLVPQENGTWNFGQIAQDLNKKNLRLGAPKLGPLTVQTQDACPNGGAAGFGARAKALRLQYTFKFITKKIKVKGKKKKMKKTIRLPLKKQGKPTIDNLAMELSFTEIPTATASQAILRTSAAQAAACVPPAMKQGIGAFFFFAAEDGMRLLLLQPQIAPLRPWAGAGAASTGGVRP